MKFDSDNCELSGVSEKKAPKTYLPSSIPTGATSQLSVKHNSKIMLPWDWTAQCCIEPLTSSILQNQSSTKNALHSVAERSGHLSHSSLLLHRHSVPHSPLSGAHSFSHSNFLISICFWLLSSGGNHRPSAGGVSQSRLLDEKRLVPRAGGGEDCFTTHQTTPHHQTPHHTSYQEQAEVRTNLEQ